MKSEKNTQPTHTQLHGYIWLTIVVLVVVIVVLTIAKCSGKEEEKMIQTTLDEQIDRFSDSMIAAQEAEDSIYRSQYQRNKGRYYDKDHYYAKNYEADTQYRQRAREAKQSLHLELNSADTVDLQQLNGIGPVFSRRIVKYRQLLGGFVKKEQLMEVYGMTEELYDKISPHLSVDPTVVAHIQINTASIDQLKRHPYLDYYQAKAIVNYRKTGKRYSSYQDLAQVALLDDETIEKISPYIEY